MSDYTSHLGATRLSGILYRLDTPINWHIGHAEGPLYTVPSGFEFDVSVPKIFRWVFNPHRKDFHKAAALHDHMLKSGWSRATAASEFYNALKADNVEFITRFVMFISVLLWRFK